MQSPERELRGLIINLAVEIEAQDPLGVLGGLDTVSGRYGKSESEVLVLFFGERQFEEHPVVIDYSSLRESFPPNQDASSNKMERIAFKVSSEIPQPSRQFSAFSLRVSPAKEATTPAAPVGFVRSDNVLWVGSEE